MCLQKNVSCRNSSTDLSISPQEHRRPRFSFFIHLSKIARHEVWHPMMRQKRKRAPLAGRVHLPSFLKNIESASNCRQRRPALGVAVYRAATSPLSTTEFQKNASFLPAQRPSQTVRRQRARKPGISRVQAGVESCQKNVTRQLLAGFDSRRFAPTLRSRQ